MLSLVYAYLLHYILHIPCFGLYKKAGKNPLHVFIPLVQDFTLWKLSADPKIRHIGDWFRMSTSYSD
jgi:hypothetical protein